jgi:hypothetical protein
VAVAHTARVTREEIIMAVTGGTRWRDELVVDTYTDYVAVARAIDLLADRGFPVETLRVVGRDVRIVEQVTGRTTPWRAAGAGALSGMWFGALAGLLLGLVTSSLFSPLLWGVAVGALLGGAVAWLAHRAARGLRDLASLRGLAAGSYDLIAAGDTYPRAVAILAQAGELPDGARAGTAGAPTA